MRKIRKNAKWSVKERKKNAGWRKMKNEWNASEGRKKRPRKCSRRERLSEPNVSERGKK